MKAGLRSALILLESLTESIDLMFDFSRIPCFMVNFQSIRDPSGHRRSFLFPTYSFADVAGRSEVAGRGGFISLFSLCLVNEPRSLSTLMILVLFYRGWLSYADAGLNWLLRSLVGFALRWTVLKFHANLVSTFLQDLSDDHPPPTLHTIKMQKTTTAIKTVHFVSACQRLPTGTSCAVSLDLCITDVAIL